MLWKIEVLRSLNTKKLLLSLLSGILLVLIFPTFNLELLGWVALVPLFIAIKEENPLASFILGLVCGLVFYGGLLYWLAPFIKYSPLVILGLLILGFYLSLYTGIFSLALSFIKRKVGLSELILAPCLWVSLEFLRSLGPQGFPWGVIGYSQYLNLPLIQIASITGVYGLSYLVILVNIALALIIGDLLVKKKLIIGMRVLPFLLLIAFLVYGLKVLSGEQGRGTIKVALIQGNIEQEVKWDPQYVESTWEIYRDLTSRATRENPDLVVWPETAMPIYLRHEEPYLRKLYDLAKASKSFLLTGYADYEGGLENFRLYNSALLISPAGTIVDKYDKIHLVPFGEYIPLKKILFFVEKIVEGPGDFSPGKRYTLFTLPKGKFGVLICYESIFPHLVRRFVKGGADFMVNITNDAWFGRTTAPYQHASMAVLRAVENRISLARAANTGVSFFIDPYGRIYEESNIFVTTYLVQEIPLRTRETFYTRWGDLFAGICLLISLLLVSLSLSRC